MHIIGEGLDILDDNNMKQIAALERRCDEMMAKNLITASDTCSDTLHYIN
jgi:hypothetical protein